MNPGAPDATKSIGTLEKTSTVAGMSVGYRIFPRDKYDNRLNLTTAGMVPNDAFTVEFDLPAYYNYSTGVSLEDWNTKFNATPTVVVNVVDQKYYEY
jgi:hypothetical protein